MHFQYEYGQTVLSPEESDGLIIPAMTKAEVNAAEANSIAVEKKVLLSGRYSLEQVLSEDALREIHRRLYGKVWSWAGEFRKTDKNIGVPFYKIGIELKNLFDDARWWLKSGKMTPDEMALRIGHRFVQIHPFPNGNGRMSRILSDMFASCVFGNPVFSWGSSIQEPNRRREYLASLKAADGMDYARLIAFARK